MKQRNNSLSIAVPKGRLAEQIQDFFSGRGYRFSFDKRKLVTYDAEKKLRLILVKNSDLPTYVNHGIAGMGICGEDVLIESGLDFYRLFRLPFGSTRMCLAASKDSPPGPEEGRITVATKFTRFTQDYFHRQNIGVRMIKLNGSVELAPLLGLAPFIVDLVETGNTLKANNLQVLKELQRIFVYLIANPAYYKLNFNRIDKFVDDLKKEDGPNHDDGNN
jgi:ATP phosphoribosyltransferase